MTKENVSAIVTIGERFIVIGADEDVDEGENRIQLLRVEDDGYAVHSDILLFTGEEMDIEGIAADDNTIYVVGSHSSKRSKIKECGTYKKNREKFHATKIKDEQNRDWLYQIVIDKEGKEVKRERISLRSIISDDPVLRAFSEIPGKENGVNIEGLAASAQSGCWGRYVLQRKAKPKGWQCFKKMARAMIFLSSTMVSRNSGMSCSGFRFPNRIEYLVPY